MTTLPQLPADFAVALASLRAATVRREVLLAEVPAPARLAPYGVALGAEIMVNDEEVATGRFILLHDPQGSPLWDACSAP